MLYRKIPHYDFSSLTFSSLTNPDFLKGMFYLRLPQLPTRFNAEKTLISIPGALEIRVICRSYDEETSDHWSVRGEGCFLFNRVNEWILEAACTMETPQRGKQDTYLIRLPLSAPFMQDGRIGLCFDGTWLRFFKDGELLNENSGLDNFCTPSGELFIDADMAGIEVASLSAPVSPSYRDEPCNLSPDFYFPYGWNTNVGDVMTFSHNGTYHLMYLIDRRHHGSRNGNGAHYICHLTTDNLIDWYEHEPITEITAPWMSYGTGTMLYHNGQYIMSYGHHTGRYQGGRPIMDIRHDAEQKILYATPFDDIFAAGGLPQGGACSVSSDGIHFTPANVLYHMGQNPSAYANDEGGITVYADALGECVWKGSSIDGPFRKAENTVNYMGVSPTLNTAECPAFFSWNGYKYLLVGFSGYYRTLSPDSDEYVDAVLRDESIYDGLAVPMVAELPGNRRVIAGWIQCFLGWGSVLMQRELLQEEGGKLGLRWLPEITPEPTGDNLMAGNEQFTAAVCFDRDASYLLETVIDPGNASKMALNLSDGEQACVIQFDFAAKRVTVNDAPIDGFGEAIPSVREKVLNPEPPRKTYWDIPDTPQRACNYTLTDIQGIDRPFTFKLMIRRSSRIISTVLDAEIAGHRTLISMRPEFFPTRASLLSDGNLTAGNVSLRQIPCTEF